MCKREREREREIEGEIENEVGREKERLKYNNKTQSCRKGDKPLCGLFFFGSESCLFFFFLKLHGLINVTNIPAEYRQGYCLTHSLWCCWWRGDVHSFPKGFSSKVNVKARFEFELTY